MLLDKKNASKYLGVSIETLDRYKDSGKLGFIRIGKRCLWTTALLNDFVEKCTIPASKLPSEREKLEVVRAGGLT